VTSVLTATHHAAHPHGSGNPSEGKKNTSGEKMVFGIVDVDLAAFAGKGKTTRRFLLRGSRTNATIKVSVPAAQFVQKAYGGS
jgi:Tfp pilus assembly protein PilW